MRRLFYMLLLLFPAIISAQLTTINLPAVEDTYISQWPTQVNNSYYSSNPLIAFYQSSTPNTKRVFLNFKIDLANIPSNAIIKSATLKLSYNSSTLSGNSYLVLRRCTSNWEETVNPATWNNQPSVTTTNQVTTYVNIGNTLTFDVKNLVQSNVKNAEIDYGWGVFLANESGSSTQSVNIYSMSHPTNLDYRPVLTISYYTPFKITAAQINHCNSASSADGFIIPTISGGAGGNTYKWYANGSTTPISGATTQNLNGRNPGWYGLEVTDSLGNKFYYAFIIVQKCKSTSLSLQFDERFTEDGEYSMPASVFLDLSKPSFNSTSLTLNSSHIYFYSSIFGNRYGYVRSLLKFNLWIDPLLEVETGTMSLYGQNHSGLNNSSKIHFNTSDFSESFPSFNIFGAFNVPNYTQLNPSSINISNTLNSTQNFTAPSINFKPFLDKWKTDNLQNYGMTIMSNATNSNSNEMQIYHSSDASSPTLRPKIDIQLLSGCDMFAELEYNLDGYYHIFDNGFIRFNFFQEYANGPLIFNIYDVNNNIVKTNSNFTSVSTTKGNNQVSLNVSSLSTNCLSNGQFVLEVVDQKNQRMYIKFYIGNSTC